MRATVLRVVVLVLITFYAFGCLFYFISLTKGPENIDVSAELAKMDAQGATHTTKRSTQSSKTIFVSMAAYRDENCPNTLHSLFTNVTKAENVFVGLVQQRDLETEPDCVDLFCKKFGEPCPRDKIRVTDLDYKEAKGPCYARYLATLLFKDEDYLLQIDAHSTFDKNWEQRLLWQIEQLPKKSIIAHHPPSRNGHGHNTIVYDCRFDNGGGGIPRPAGYGISRKRLHVHADGLPRPFPAPFLGAGLVFVPRSFVHEVPWDPHLEFMFEGEELLLTVLPKMLCFHLYRSEIGPKNTREDKSWFYNHIKGSPRLAVDRLLVMFNRKARTDVPEESLLELDKYGMGKVRSVKTFEEYVGIPKEWSRTMKQTINWCDFEHSTKHHFV